MNSINRDANKSMQEALVAAAATMGDGDRSTQAMRLIAASLPIIVEGLSNRSIAQSNVRQEIRSLRKQLRKVHKTQQVILEVAAKMLSIFESLEVVRDVPPPPPRERAGRVVDEVEEPEPEPAVRTKPRSPRRRQDLRRKRQREG